MTAYPPQPGITIWSSGGHEQSLWNKTDIILSAIFYQHHWPYGYILYGEHLFSLWKWPCSMHWVHFSLTNIVCCLEEIVRFTESTQSYIQEWIMVCVLLHRLLQVSADILSSDEGWEIKRVCQFPLIIWACAFKCLTTNALQ